MSSEFPLQDQTDFDLLAANDGRRTTVREVIGLLSVVAWRTVADPVNRKLNPLPSEQECHEIGCDLVITASTIALAGTALFFMHDPNGLQP